MQSGAASKERWELAQEHHKGFWGYWKETETEERKRLYTEYWQHYLNLLYAAVPVAANTRVLEIGCGIDGVINYVDGGEKYAVDPLMDYFLSEFEMRPDIKWAQALGEKLPYDDNYFDVVITTNTLDHTLNPQAILQEIRRVLKKDGVLMVSVDVYTPGVRLYRRIREKFGMGDHPHPYAFSRSDVEELIARSGLRVTKVHNGIGDFGKYTHQKLSLAKRANASSSQPAITESHYERGMRILREKGIFSFVYAAFDNVAFLAANKLKKTSSRARHVVKKKVDAYSELDLVFIATK